MPSPPAIAAAVVGADDATVAEWRQWAGPEVPVDPAPDVAAALAAVTATSAAIGCVVDATSRPPLDLAGLVRRASTRPGLEGIPWLLLVSRGAAIDDGAMLDHGVHPDGPFTPPAGPLRAVSSQCGGLAVVELERLRRLGLAAARGVDDLAAAGWDAGLASYASPWLAHPITTRTTATTAPPWDEDDVAATLARVRPQPTITVAIRSDGTRPHLLRRALRSVRSAAAISPIEATLLIGPDPAAALAGAGEAAAGVTPVQVSRADVPGRTAAMLEAIAAADTDYLWFVDDDDEAEARGALRIRNAVHAGTRPIVIGATAAFEESWPVGGEEPSRRAEVRAHNPYEWHRGFTGWNPIPNCALVMPVETAKRRLAEVALRHDLGEDFALQLALLTAPGAQVAVAPRRIAAVSVRPGGDTTIDAADRGEWQRNLAAFLSDLGMDPAAATHAFWQLGAALRALPARPWDGTPGAGPAPGTLQRVTWSIVPHRVRSAAKRLLGAESAGGGDEAAQSRPPVGESGDAER